MPGVVLNDYASQDCIIAVDSLMFYQMEFKFRLMGQTGERYGAVG